VRVVTYGDRAALDGRVGDVACHLRALAACSAYNASDVVLDRVDQFSARNLARRLALVLDRVAA
jgi:hypothetical protein